MTPEKWEQVGRIFDEATALPSEQRSSFLDAACGEDGALRREVQSLLELEGRAGDFLRAGAMEDAALGLAEVDSPSLAGRNLGRYEVRSPIGAGGMGKVYRAHDVELKRDVALKVLLNSFSQNDELLQRFNQEARAASALNHPNIVTIHEIGEVDGCRFIISEYVEGETLRQRLTRGRVNTDEAISVATAIAEGLAAAHTVGVIHRDIKPENIMLRPDGYVKILDFGLAKLNERKGSELSSGAGFNTKSGMVMGTPRYMSPEQARGLTVDSRTDVWSLGVVLYEMLSGRAPFEGQTNSDVIAAILEREPLPLKSLASDVPAELQRIVAKALRKDQEGRYQGMRDMLVDLKSMRREGHSEGLSGKIRQHKTRAAFMLAALIVGVAGVVYAAYLTYQRIRANAQPANRTLSRLTFDEGIQREVTWSPDSRFIAYSSFKSGNFDIWVQPVAGGDAVQVTHSPANDWQPDWSPDGTKLVFRSERDGGGLFLVPVLGGPERKISSHGYHPLWSPDGTKILFSNMSSMLGTSSGAKLYVMSPSGDPPREILSDLLVDITGFQWAAWHPDGQRVSVWGNRRNIGLSFWTGPITGGGTVVKSEREPDVQKQFNEQFTEWNYRYKFRLRWAPSGRNIYFNAFAQGVSNVWKVTIDPQTLRWVAGPERLTTGLKDSDVALSPDGTRLAFTMRTETTRSWSVPFDGVGGKVKGEWEAVTPEGSIPDHLNLSYDGKHLLYRTKVTGSQKWELREKSLVDNRDRLLIADAGGIYTTAWSRDGTRIAYNNHGALAVVVQPVAGGEEQIIASGESDLVWDWSADGQWILATTKRSGAGLPRGGCKLVMYPVSAAPDAGAQMRVMTSHAEYPLYEGRFSPDDQWVCFLANKAANGNVIYVMRSEGGPWMRVTEETGWSDKPRWSPDGKTIYFVSDRVTGLFNVWGIRFDQKLGKPVGEPFLVNLFDNPGKTVWSDLSPPEMTTRANRLVLPITDVTGNIWMLDKVDR